MAHYKPRDVVLISFPFTHLRETKKRPALILLNVGDGDVLVARITSKIMDTDFDIAIREWKNAGLIFPSVVRLHKIGTIQEDVIEKKIGILPDKDWKNARAVIKKLFKTIE